MERAAANHPSYCPRLLEINSDVTPIDVNHPLGMKKNDPQRQTTQIAPPPELRLRPAYSQGSGMVSAPLGNGAVQQL